MMMRVAIPMEFFGRKRQFTMQTGRFVTWCLYLWLYRWMFTVLMSDKNASLQSESDLFALPLSEDYFPRLSNHAISKYIPSDRVMTQGERVESISATAKEFLRVMRAIDLPVFLEAGTLLGWHRTGGIIPWDDDADFGMLLDDCMKKFPGFRQFQRAVESRIDQNRFRALRFSCIGEGGDEGHMTFSGKLLDKKTGFYVDLFHFEKTAQSVQRAQLDPKRVHPLDELLPLREVNFLNERVFVPHKYLDWLHRQFGEDLSTPFSWHFTLYLNPSLITWLLVAGFAMALLDPGLLIVLTCSRIYYSGGYQMIWLSVGVLVSFFGFIMNFRVRRNKFWIFTLTAISIFASLAIDAYPFLIRKHYQ